MKLRIVSLMFLVGVLLFGACQSGKGKVVAKIKGLKITRAEIDSVFGVAPDKQPDAAKVKGYLKEKLDQQALYLQALKMDFHKQLENKAILRNIQMIESANYFSSEVLRKNWGFTEKEVLNRYRQDKGLYRKTEPAKKDKPTEAEKKALNDYQKNPYKDLDVVRSKVLRTLLLETPSFRQQLETFKKESGSVAPDSQQLMQKEEELVSRYIAEVESTTFERLKADHQVKLFPYSPKLTEEEIKAEWEATKSAFKRQPDITIQHIEVKNKKQAEKIKKELDLPKGDFAQYQKKYSVNKQTLGQTFKIYPNENIPGLPGDSRSVYAALTTVNVGSVSMPIGLKPDAATETYHLVKVVSRETESIMSFEEAKSQVQQALYTKKQFSIPDNTVLAKVDGRDITAEEVFTMLYKMSPMVINRYKSEEGRTILVEKYYLRFLLFNMEAKRLGLYKEPSLKERVKTNQRMFLVQDFNRNSFEQTLGMPDNVLMDYYKTHEDSFKAGGTLRPFDAVRGDVVNKLLVNDSMVERYYYFNQEDYLDASGAVKPLSGVSQNIRFTLLSKARKEKTEEALQRYRKAGGLRIYVKEWDYARSAETPEALFELAKKQHEDRQYSEAVSNYNEIRFRWPAYPENPQIAMALAQIYVEQRNFQKAINEYKKFMRLYPDSKDKYKAQFMIGFVYSEHLNDKEKAIAAYQAVVDNYPCPAGKNDVPPCDLTDDAQFMIENLKSGKEFSIPEDDGAATLPEESKK
ncbi:MAG: hypothetical protein A2293_11940 [Elusimicrobia bacterium RIFOXYB2_FULL_49_7]|nr:MAG: hypothetical protein A2293_11940 [Elusimicrobia bacterium RIFOXYB2_FULL_49_7]